MSGNVRRLFVRSRATRTGGRVYFLGPVTFAAYTIAVCALVAASQISKLPLLQTLAVAMTIGAGIWSFIYLFRGNDSADDPSHLVGGGGHSRPEVSRVLALLQQAGEADAMLGRGIRNGDVDIESARLVVEVKENARTVQAHTLGSGAFREATHRRKQPVIIARGWFLPEAVARATKFDIALFSYEQGVLLAENEPARTLFPGR